MIFKTKRSNIGEETRTLLTLGGEGGTSSLDWCLLKCLKLFCEVAGRGQYQEKDSGHYMGDIPVIPVLKISPTTFDVKTQWLGPKIIVDQRSQLLSKEKKI